MTKDMILLIEDNRDDEELTIRALRKHNIANEIRVARDGAEALEVLHGLGAELPQLVVLDLNLISSASRRRFGCSGCSGSSSIKARPAERRRE